MMNFLKYMFMDHDSKCCVFLHGGLIVDFYFIWKKKIKKKYCYS